VQVVKIGKTKCNSHTRTHSRLLSLKLLDAQNGHTPHTLACSSSH